MDEIEVLVRESLKYTEIVYEYCKLASMRSLTPSQADRLEEILTDASSDSWLEFLMDEADHILAHELGLIQQRLMHHQQDELRKSLDRLWCDRLLQEIQQQQCSQKIQQYLQQEGLYDGAIDGYLGPRTQSAIELFKKIGSRESGIGSRESGR